MPGAVVAVLKDGEIVDAAARPAQHRRPGSRRRPTPSSRSARSRRSGRRRSSCSSSTTACSTSTLRIRPYLPEFRARGRGIAASSITTRQLLSHQAGFEGDVFTDTGRGDDAIEKYLEHHRRASRSSSRRASSSPTTTSASACSAASSRCCAARPGRQALVEHLVTPLGLTHVAPSAYEAILFRAAVGHVGPGEDGVETPAPVWALARSNEPAGSMLAMRPRDLLGFVADAPRRRRGRRRHPRPVRGVRRAPCSRRRSRCPG